jgi:hypothetical protein
MHGFGGGGPASIPNELAELDEFDWFDEFDECDELDECDKLDELDEPPAIPTGTSFAAWSCPPHAIGEKSARTTTNPGLPRAKDACDMRGEYVSAEDAAIPLFSRSALRRATWSALTRRRPSNDAVRYRA